ncbi:MAG: inositol monophosphatase family protein [Bacteriovorax sp.]|nr:inositol monophosphatase family protein [Bacteriovorax sp.]
MKTIIKKPIKVKYEDVLKLSLKLAKISGAHLMKKQLRISSLKITMKEAQGIASNADTESEKIIIDGIKKIYPDHLILAEESAFKEFQGEMSRYEFLKNKEWVWIIDPLDGTNNFLNGLDYFGVCISLAHFGEPVVGVVLRPSSGECFYAIKGKGTKTINLLAKKSKIISLKKSTNKKSLKNSLLVTGFTTEKGPVFEAEFTLFKNMIGRSRGIRRMGSAALDLCYVSKGIFDCFWERGLAAWDISAAGLICVESGVVVTDYSGQKFHPFQETILAARAPLHGEILSIFQ